MPVNKNDNLFTTVRTMMSQRHNTYGDPKELFTKTAGLWSCHLQSMLTPSDVVMMLMAFKLSSLHQNTSPDRVHDIMCDVVGYAAIMDYLNGNSTLPTSSTTSTFKDTASGGKDFLDQVSQLVDEDRQDDYGDEKLSHALIAKQWEIMTDVPIRPIDVDILMMYYKLARMSGPIPRRDTIVDLAGYALIADRNRDDSVNVPLPVEHSLFDGDSIILGDDDGDSSTTSSKAQK